MPAFSQRAKITGKLTYAAAGAQMYIRTTGSAATYSHLIAVVGAASTEGSSEIDIITSTAQQIDVYITADALWSCYYQGWYFPVGM